MRTLMMTGSLFLLAACQDVASAPSEPGYPAPNNHLASRAYQAALEFDGYENLAEESRPERMAAFRYQLDVEGARRERTRDDTQTALEAIRRLDLENCEWRALSRDDLPDWARVRVQTAPPAAYACSFTLYFQRSGPPPGPRLTEEGQGLFFMREGDWVYMGRMPNPYN